jgi:hypothetical protein
LSAPGSLQEASILLQEIDGADILKALQKAGGFTDDKDLLNTRIISLDYASSTGIVAFEDYSSRFFVLEPTD